MIRAVRLAATLEQLRDPGSKLWGSLAEESVRLEPTPIGSQPSEYVINAWRDRPYGGTGQVQVQAVHNGAEIFIRLSWRDETADTTIGDNDRFTDGAAVLFPVREDAVLQSMGSPDRPVNAWYWRPDLEAPMNVTATGLGTTVRHGNGSLRSAAVRAGRGWRLVMSRPMVVKQTGMVQLRAGWGRKVAFAVWQGSNQERGGLKAATLEWQPLEIEE